MQRIIKNKRDKKDMEIILLIITLIAIFCIICSFFIGIDLGRELQKKEQEKQDKILKEIRNEGYNVNT